MIKKENSFFFISIPRYLDLGLIIRGLASINVVWWHTEGRSFFDRNWTFLATSGRLCVWLFFVISGYVMAYGFSEKRYDFSKEGFKSFYWNRFLRIYPLFVTVSVVCFISRFFLSSVPVVTLKFIFEQLFMLQWRHSYDLNGVFWTLGIEMQFYLILPLLLFIQSGSWNKLAWRFLLFFGFLCIPIFDKAVFHISFDNRSLWANLAAFQSGIIVNSVRPRILAHKQNFSNLKLWGMALIAIAVIMVENSIYKNDYKISGIHVDFFIPFIGLFLTSLVGGGCMFIHVILEDRKISLNFLTKILSLFGVLSYGIYAWHSFFQENFKYFDPRFYPTFVVTLVTSVLTYFLVEKQVLKFKLLS